MLRESFMNDVGLESHSETCEVGVRKGNNIRLSVRVKGPGLGMTGWLSH